MNEQAQGEAADLNEENIENVVDKGELKSDNVTTGSETEESVDDVLDDILSKIKRLEKVQENQTRNEVKLKEEQKALKLKRKSTKDELRKAKIVAKKFGGIVKEPTFLERLFG